MITAVLTVASAAACGDATGPGDGARTIAALANHNGAISFVHLDPTTGNATLTVPRPEITGTVQGETAIDVVGGRYITHADGLIALDIHSGAVLSNVAAPSFSGIQYDPASAKAVGVRWFNGSEQFVRVDLATGALTVVASIPGVEYVDQGGSSISPSTGRYYLTGGGGGQDRIFTIDIATGALIASPAVTGSGLSGARFDQASGQLIALSHRSGVEELIRIDPNTGAITRVGLVPEVQYITSGETAIDAATGQFVFLGDGAAGSRLYSVSTAAGIVIARPEIGQVGNLQFIP